MPIYEYKCPNGHLFEVFHGMTEPGPTVCEVCGAAPLQRVLHPVAVHYKGSGFYSTDYGRGGRKRRTPARATRRRRRLGSSDGGSSSSDSSSSPYNAETTKKIKELRQRSAAAAAPASSD